MTPSSNRVATRHLIRLAARDACRTTYRTRTASVDLTERVLVAVAEGAYLSHGGNVRVASLVSKLAELAKALKRFPNLWEKLKELLGIESLSALPGKIKGLLQEAYGALRKLLTKAFDSWPLKLFTLPESKLFSVNKLLEALMKKYPQFDKWLESNVKPRVDQFDKWLRQYLPTVSKVLMVGIYLWLWMNTTEFEWDIKGILDAATGHLSLADLLAGLPGTVIGGLLGTFNLGTFSLLPAAIAARVLFLLGKRYLVWTGSGFKFDAEALNADFGIAPSEVPA